MFSPSAWLSENESTMNYESDDSILSNLNSAPPSIHQTPKNPIDEFHRMQHQTIKDSPNARLADFFAKKGNAPLSEIELEGVKALLEKTNSAQTSPKTPRNERNEDEEDKIEILKPKSSDSAVKTTPSFKATYNNTVNSTVDNSFDNTANSPHITSARKRRVFDFSGFPSPYRTSRLKETSFMLDDYQSDKPETSSEAKIEEPKEEKKMSNTASALLSFIENHESTEEKPKEEIKTKKKIDYSNPYATISSSHRKNKKASSTSSTTTSNPNRKLTAFEQLEQSLAPTQEQQQPKQQPQQQPQPQQPELSNFNKYKPAKSSSLRESVSLGDTTDQSVDEIEVDEPESVSKKREPSDTSSSFKVPEVPQNNAPTTITSGKLSEPAQEESKPTFNSKPLFSFAPKPNPPSFSQQSSQQLSIQKEEQENSLSSQSNGFDIRPPSSEFTFRFPNAESLGYTTSDLNEQKVSHFKTFFTF